MTPQQAKEILSLYRPGTADASDPDFAEALQFCERDPELKRWFAAHCELHTAIRAKLRQAPAPEGLQQQILSERKIVRPGFSRNTWLAAAAALLVVALFAALILNRDRQPGFDDYRNRMTSTALRAYAMDLETSDLDQIQAFLTEQQAVADYTVPMTLRDRAVAVGCVALRWEGQPVSMICFASGRPLKPGEKSDLFLFVAETDSVPDALEQRAREIATISRAATVMWNEGGKTYLLVADGDAEFLRQYL